MAVTGADKVNLTEEQQKQLQDITDQWYAAESDDAKQALHDKAEAIRNSAGYTSNADGSYAGLYTASNDTSQLQSELASLKEELANTQAAQTKTTTASADATKAYNEEYQKWFQNYITELNDEYTATQEAQTAAIDKATAAQIASLNAQLEDSKNQIKTEKEQQAYYKSQNTDNARLANAAAGDLGGTGQAQVTAQQIAYDNNMLQLDLEAENIVRDTNTAIAEAEANGETEKAALIAEIGEAKLNLLYNSFNTYTSNEFNAANFIDQMNASSTETAYEQSQDALNNFYTKLNAGIMDPEEAKNLGFTDTEIAQLQAQLDKANSTDTNGNGGSTLTGMDAIYADLYKAGVTPEQAAVYLRTKAGGSYSEDTANVIAEAYTNWYNDYTDYVDARTPDDAGYDTAIDSLDYSPDEGTFVWNGKIYTNPTYLYEDIQDTPMTDAQYNKLIRTLEVYGFKGVTK